MQVLKIQASCCRPCPVSFFALFMGVINKVIHMIEGQLSVGENLARAGDRVLHRVVIDLAKVIFGAFAMNTHLQS